MERKHLTFRLDIKAEPAEDGTFTGYAAVFGNVDAVNDVVLPGAFTNTLKNRTNPFPLCYEHDTTEVIGVCEEITEDENGLLVKCRLAIKTEDGLKAYELLKMKAITGLSIGYAVPPTGAIWKDGIRQLKEIELYEVSLVLFPANEQATVTAVKSDDMDERKLERILRDAGFSAKEAKTVISQGFKSLKAQRDVDDAVKLLEEITKLYRG
jgi:HK97 family phage prohead protease